MSLSSLVADHLGTRSDLFNDLFCIARNIHESSFVAPMVIRQTLIEEQLKSLRPSVRNSLVNILVHQKILSGTSNAFVVTGTSTIRFAYFLTPSPPISYKNDIYLKIFYEACDKLSRYVNSTFLDECIRSFLASNTDIKSVVYGKENLKWEHSLRLENEKTDPEIFRFECGAVVDREGEHYVSIQIDFRLILSDNSVVEEVATLLRIDFFGTRSDKHLFVGRVTPVSFVNSNLSFNILKSKELSEYMLIPFSNYQRSYNMRLLGIHIVFAYVKEGVSSETFADLDSFQKHFFEEGWKNKTSWLNMMKGKLSVFSKELNKRKLIERVDSVQFCPKRMLSLLMKKKGVYSSLAGNALMINVHYYMNLILRHFIADVQLSHTFLPCVTFISKTTIENIYF